MSATEKRKRLQASVLLEKAAESQVALACAYRELGWDLSAEQCESEAAELRRRSELFKNDNTPTAGEVKR